MTKKWKPDDELTPAERERRHEALGFFFSNKTARAHLKESEDQLARILKTPLADLRTIPREQWDHYLDRDVTLPQGVTDYLAQHPVGQPLSRDEVQNMEIAVETFHGVTAPYCIVSSPSIQTIGRAWEYVPEAAPYVSGFSLMMDEE